MNLSRRSFLKQSTLLAASAAASTAALPEFVKAEEPAAVPRPKIAVLGRLPDAAKIEEMQKLGIDGMEISGQFTMEEAKAAKKIADAAGFRFHSCMGGGSVERMELAAELGADAVLVVPGRVSGVKMPEPWEFKIQFDEKTNLLEQVVEGDNSPYADYIKAHNEAMQRARNLVEGLIPAAEKLGITMGLENVWNNMWVHPAFAANFVLSFGVPQVQAYFDCGNNVKYYPRPQDWFDAFQGKVIRVHIKDFKLNEDGHGGRFVRVMEGSIDWPAVRAKMIEWKYDRWITVELEGNPLTLEEQAKRMKLILDGKPLS